MADVGLGFGGVGELWGVEPSQMAALTARCYGHLFFSLFQRSSFVEYVDDCLFVVVAQAHFDNVGKFDQMNTRVFLIASNSIQEVLGLKSQ